MNAFGVRDGLTGDMLVSSRHSLVGIYVCKVLRITNDQTLFVISCHHSSFWLSKKCIKVLNSDFDPEEAYINVAFSKSPNILIKSVSHLFKEKCKQ